MVQRADDRAARESDREIALLQHLEQAREVFFVRFWNVNCQIGDAGFNGWVWWAQPSDDFYFHVRRESKCAAVVIKAFEFLLAHLLEHDGIVDDPRHAYHLTNTKGK